ncbi:MAG: PSD1 domain-containing protein [Verrucomicrobiaceae bacterium]|nr:PSD1 domain-containing protein [Verrucomicrobiaceae bacterium]
MKLGAISFLSILLAAGSSQGAGEVSADQTAFFEKNIRPILINRCYECHSVEKGKAKGSLTLDSREAILKGGDSGPALIAGKPEKSLLIESVHYKNQDLQMPPKGALPSQEIQLLEDWIKMGAPDPRAAVASKMHGGPRTIDLAEGAKHWAFSPISRPKVPTQAAGGNPIDAFITAKLAEKGMKLSPEADARTLIRRITFDLTGLPPTPQEVEGFVAERIKNPESALRNLIDRLLASHAYGEKWGRHWLDVARYSDSNGLDENIALGTAWRYRDYVVKAFNDDLPFDQFVIEQLAGDLMKSGDVATRQRRITATGFLNLGAKVLAEPDKDKLRMDVIDEQIDVMGRAFMGLTLGCARCHEHKFDPIPHEDYYALAAIFKSTESFSSDRIGALSTAFEAPMGDFEAFANVKAAECVLDDQKSAIAKLEAEANKKLKDEVRSQAVAYLMNAAALPVAPTLSQVRPVAEKAGLRPHILLNCRVWLAANESHPFFKPWQEALRTRGGVSHLREYYTLMFKQASTLKDVKADKNSESLLHQAKAALDDPKGFLALPPEPIILYPKAIADQLNAMKDNMMSVQSNLPDLPTALAVTDSPKILKELPLHIRGSHLALGKPVPRGFIQVVQASLKKEAPAFKPDQSGRLELARWLASPEHPLTSRVTVNRLWTWHFNQGIVSSVDNFGLLGQKPAHPELLDYLARWFTDKGWSVKAMHRLILTSKTYLQSSEVRHTPDADPENQLLWHFPVRRLEAEEIRDALLHVAGMLDTATGGKTIPRRNREFVFNHTSKDLTTYGSTRRALYLPVIRNNLYDLFQQFDYPDPATSTGRRESSVVSPQALLLMNSDLSQTAAEALAKRLLTHKELEARIRAACGLAYAREATETDLRRCRDFLTAADGMLASTEADPAKREQAAWSLLAQTLLMSSEFIYVR